MQHRLQMHDRAIAVVSLDYFFLTEAGIQLRSETDHAIAEARSKGEIAKCLIVRCAKTKATFAHVVPFEGVSSDEDGLAVDMVLRDVEWLGHTRIILKGDNEPALQALLKAALEMIKVECWA